MFTPFPFPHAQLSAYYVLFSMPAVVVLMIQWTDDIIIGAMLTFLTVTCLSAIQEVARELENPFRNLPNEIPVVTIQAQYNETLLSIFAGFHPDAYWEDEAKKWTENQPESSRCNEEVTHSVEELLKKVNEQGEELQRLKESLKNKIESESDQKSR